MFSLVCNLTKNDAEFLPVEISSKKVRVDNVDFSTIKITSKKVGGNNVYFSTSEITPKKVRGNNVDFLIIEITSKKVRGNDVDFSTIEIMWKKVRGNDVGFSISKITSKKYVKMTWKFVEIWPSTYRYNTDVESTWMRCGVPVGLLPLHGFVLHEIIASPNKSREICGMELRF